jgi:transcription elongation regulator 1
MYQSSKYFVFIRTNNKRLVYFRTTFSEISSRHSKDERFRAVEKIRDREAWFHEYVQELKTREKEGGSSRHSEKEKVRFLSIEIKSIIFILAKKRLFLIIKRIKSHSRFLLV